MVGIAAAVGMVATDRDLALMIEQRIERMQRLARRCRNQLGEERPVAVGEMGVDLEPRLLAVMSIETAGGTAEPTGLEELPVITAALIYMILRNFENFDLVILTHLMGTPNRAVA
jgi:hypothetical protein